MPHFETGQNSFEIFSRRPTVLSCRCRWCELWHKILYCVNKLLGQAYDHVCMHGQPENRMPPALFCRKPKPNPKTNFQTPVVYKNTKPKPKPVPVGTNLTTAHKRILRPITVSQSSAVWYWYTQYRTKQF